VTIRVTANVEQLLDAGGRPEASFHRRSLPYVSGTVVRGAFAQRWINEHGLPTATTENQRVFTDIFHRSIHWGQLSPHGSAVKSLSLLTHKHREQINGEQCAGTGVDRAYLTDEERVLPQMTCPVAGCRLEPSKGGWASAAQLLSSRTRAGLVDSGGRREVAEDGKLFTREGIRAGSILVGRLGGSHEWLTGLLAQTEPIAMRLGGQKSVNGRSMIELSNDLDTLDPPTPLYNPNRVLLVAESPCVLVDDAGRPQLVPRLGELADLAGSEPHIIGSWARPVTIGGWDLVSGLPKPEEIAVTAGSTWLLEFDKPVDPEGLNRLQGGLGLRRIEGYGAMSVNPPTATDEYSQRHEQAAERPSDLRKLASELQQVFSVPHADLNWAVGLLLDLATEMTVVEPTTQEPAADIARIAVDRTMDRARAGRLGMAQRNLLERAAGQPPDGIRKLAMLVKAGL